MTLARFLIVNLAAAAIVLATPSAAQAQTHPHEGPGRKNPTGIRKVVPEFDPAAAGAIAAVIAGGGLLVARRRKR
jgi:LPXTG-motif cell wall-anchored protein